MLNIRNIEKIVSAIGCSVKVKRLERNNKNHSQRTYDILYEHVDYPNREFFLTILRESKRRSSNDELEYPMAICELTGATAKSKNLAVWESNLKTSTIFLDFVDALTHQLVNY
jgi:hypothetical protein